MHSFLPLIAGLELSTLPQQLVNGIMIGAIYALIALGYTMVYGVLRLINFAHGEVFMLGAYVALFISWIAAAHSGGGDYAPLVGPNAMAVAGVVSLVFGLALAGGGLAAGGAGKLGKGLKLGGGAVASIGALAWLLAKFQPQAINLVLMMVGSMVACAIVGVAIEFFAYRPMRSEPRIAALITAIGVSLLLQYGGQLFLPNSPPPSINERVNPYRSSIAMNLVSPPRELRDQLSTAQNKLVAAKADWDSALTHEKNEFNLSPAGVEARDKFHAVERDVNDLTDQASKKTVSITIPQGYLIMLVATIVLMFGLWHLVMRTATGRAMRAVSFDFEPAALMGVNVNQVVTMTFIIGSAMAGAGAMMNATFIGTPLTSFYGLVPGIKAFVAAVLGGIGNIPGAVLGGLLMGVAETLVVWSGASNVKDAVAFVILIAVLMFRPGGLLGSAKVEKV